MTPTLASLFFPNDVAAAEAERRILVSPRVEDLRRGLHGVTDAQVLRTTEHGIGDALRAVLDVRLLDVPVRGWRDHPGPEARPLRQPHASGFVVLGLGEHEMVSVHAPRVDVMGPAGIVASLPFEARLELSVQGATLRMDDRGRVMRVSIGACSGDGTLTLDGEEIATFHAPDIRFPEEMEIEAGARRPRLRSARLRLPEAPSAESPRARDAGA